MRRMLTGTGWWALAAAAGAAPADGPVVLRAEAAVAGPFVRLAELIEPASLTPAREQAWRDIFLGAVPAGGAERVLSVEDIRAELRKHDAAGGALAWAGPVEVVVRAGAAGGGADDGVVALRPALADAIREFVLAGVPGVARDHLTVVIADVAGPGLPGDVEACRVGPVSASDAAPVAGLRRFRVEVAGPEGAATLVVAARVRQAVSGARARRTIAAGATIQAADVELARAEVDGPVAAPAPGDGSVVGRRARARIEKGRFLEAALIAPPPAVRARDGVTATIRDAASRVMLTYPAVALDAGAAGERVRIQRPGARVAGWAVVTGAGTVEIVVDNVGRP